MSVNVGGQTRGRGAEAMAEEEKKEEQSKINPQDYSCEVILEKTTKDKANDRKLPSDAFNVYYVVDEEERLDVTRSGKMVNVFNFYHFVKGGNDSLGTTRREMMFINMLQGLHPKEAEILVLIKDKDLETKYSISIDNVKQAYPQMTWGWRG